MKNHMYFAIFILALIGCQNKKETTADVEDVGKSGKVYGIDISHDQKLEIDNLDSEKDTLTYVICKATEGISITDPDFANNWEVAKQKGFVRGAYHLYYCKDSAESQVKHYLSVIGAPDEEGFACIIDFEGTQSLLEYDKGIESVQSGLLNFLILLEKETGRKPILYTGLDAANTYLDNPAFAGYDLWIADYSRELHVPKAWSEKGWLIWQKSKSYRLDSHTDDLDVFNGTVDDFNEYIQTH